MAIPAVLVLLALLAWEDVEFARNQLGLYQEETEEGLMVRIATPGEPTALAVNTVAINGCSDVSFTINPDTYITNGQTGGTYNWTFAYDAGLTVQSAGSSPGSITETLRNESGSLLFATYTVTPIEGGCTGDAFDIRIGIESEPDAVDVTVSSECSDVSFTIDPQDLRMWVRCPHKVKKTRLKVEVGF